MSRFVNIQRTREFWKREKSFIYLGLTNFIRSKSEHRSGDFDWFSKGHTNINMVKDHCSFCNAKRNVPFQLFAYISNCFIFHAVPFGFAFRARLSKAETLSALQKKSECVRLYLKANKSMHNANLAIFYVSYQLFHNASAYLWFEFHMLDVLTRAK